MGIAIAEFRRIVELLGLKSEFRCDSVAQVLASWRDALGELQMLRESRVVHTTGAGALAKIKQMEAERDRLKTDRDAALRAAGLALVMATANKNSLSLPASQMSEESTAVSGEDGEQCERCGRLVGLVESEICRQCADVCSLREQINVLTESNSKLLRLLDVPLRKLVYLCRDYPDDKESKAWLTEARAALPKPSQKI